MPPPPVAGAAAGTGLADAVWVCVLVGVGVGVGVGVADTESPGEELALALAESVAVLLAEIEDVGEVLPPGENDGDGPAEGVDPEQAERVMEASNAMVPHPVMANLALSPGLALVVRTFMEPPHLATRPLTARPEDISPKRRGP